MLLLVSWIERQQDQMGQTLTLLSMSLSDSEFDICFDLLDVLIISSGDTMTMILWLWACAFCTKCQRGYSMWHTNSLTGTYIYIVDL